MLSTGSMLNVYMYENKQLLSELSSLLAAGQKSGAFTKDQLENVQRILHTIKGSSGMLGFSGITNLIHTLEDVYAHLAKSGVQKRHFQAIINLSYRTLIEIESITTRVRRGDEPAEGKSALTKQVQTLYQTISTAQPSNSETPVKVTQQAAPAKQQAAPAVLNEKTQPKAAKPQDGRGIQSASPRMANVSSLLFVMEHLVGGIAAKTGKKVAFYAIGKQTRLDKHIQNKLADPLMHIVRNALDHGIEPSEERIALGKSPVGRVTIKAHRHEDKIVIFVIDDGRGLDKQALIAQGIKHGRLSAPAQDITDEQVQQLVFDFGISTKAEVTTISGRGVGMNAAKSAITELGGTIGISSTPRRGTCVKITVPQTLFTAAQA